MNKASYNMSDTACRERTQMQREHDKALEDIKELERKLKAMLDAIILLHRMANINRESINSLADLIQEKETNHV